MGEELADLPAVDPTPLISPETLAFIAVVLACAFAWIMIKQWWETSAWKRHDHREAPMSGDDFYD